MKYLRPDVLEKLMKLQGEEEMSKYFIQMSKVRLTCLLIQGDIDYFNLKFKQTNLNSISRSNPFNKPIIIFYTHLNKVYLFLMFYTYFYAYINPEYHI